MATKQARFRALLLTLAVGALLIVAIPPAYAVAPANDDFDSATVVGPLPYTATEDTSQATTNADDPTPSCTGGSVDATVWFSFTPSQTQRIAADTFDSNYDTTLSVYTGTRTSLNEIACNDDFQSSGQSSMAFDAQSGTNYHFMVGSLFGGGTLHFTVDVGPANDDFNDATVIDTLPDTQSENTISATKAGDDPNPSCDFGTREATVWFSFTPTENLRLSADTFGSDYDTNLSAWTGSRGALSPVACNDDAGGGLRSRVQFDAQNGTTYYFMVAGAFQGGQLTFTLEIGRKSTKLTLSASKPWVFVGEGVKLTAHLGAYQDVTNTQISIYGTPKGGTKKLFGQGSFDANGNFSIKTALGKTTVFQAEWAGDDRYFPATSNKKKVYLGVDPGDWFGTTSQGYTIEFILKNGTHLTWLEVTYRINADNCPGSVTIDHTLKFKPPLRLANRGLHVLFKYKTLLRLEVTGKFKTRFKAKGTLDAAFRDPGSGCHGDVHGVGWNAIAF